MAKRLNQQFKAYRKIRRRQRALLGVAFGHVVLCFVIVIVLAYSGIAVDLELALYSAYTAGFVFNVLMAHWHWKMARRLPRRPWL